MRCLCDHVRVSQVRCGGGFRSQTNLPEEVRSSHTPNAATPPPPYLSVCVCACVCKPVERVCRQPNKTAITCARGMGTEGGAWTGADRTRQWWHLVLFTRHKHYHERVINKSACLGLPHTLARLKSDTERTSSRCRSPASRKHLHFIPFLWQH